MITVKLIHSHGLLGPVQVLCHCSSLCAYIVPPPNFHHLSLSLASPSIHPRPPPVNPPSTPVHPPSTPRPPPVHPPSTPRPPPVHPPSIPLLSFTVYLWRPITNFTISLYMYMYKGVFKGGGGSSGGSNPPPEIFRCFF